MAVSKNRRHVWIRPSSHITDSQLLAWYKHYYGMVPFEYKRRPRVPTRLNRLIRKMNENQPAAGLKRFLGA